MKMLFVAACGLLLTGCAAVGSLSEPTRINPMQSDGQSYAQGPAGSYEPPPAEERLTTSCTMKGKGVQCF